MKKLQPYQRIESQEELDNLLNEDSPIECFVMLNFGLRSSKDIYLNGDGDYSILNEIDDSEEIIKHNELMNSFIGEAITKKALFKY